MTPKSTGLDDFLSKYKDEDSCQKYFEGIRFRKGDYCPHCGFTTIYRFDDGKRYRCASCKKDFTIKTGTVFGESKIPLRKWFIAIYLLTTCRKGISSVQLAKQVGVTQKTAWFMDHRIRKAMKQGRVQLFGTVEADETYVGGKEKNKHRSKRVTGAYGRSLDTKTPVFGILQRGGEIRVNVIPDARMRTIESKIVEHERGYIGIYHWMSRKHLQRYVDEFAYRFNTRDVDFTEVFSQMVSNVTKSTVLPYKALIADAKP